MAAPHPSVEGTADRFLGVPEKFGRNPAATTSAPQELAPPDLVEAAALLVERSKIVSGARLDALLDAAVLASEQVQDVRISRLENPPAPPLGELFFGMLLTFFLESTVAGVVARAFSKAVVSRIIKQHRVFMVLPKSPDGKKIAERARQLAGAKAVEVRAGRLRGVTHTQQSWLTQKVTRRVERGDVGVYADWALNLAIGPEAVATNLVAGAKAVAPWGQQQLLSALKDEVRPPLPGVADTPGVALLGHAMAFRSTHRAASDYLHAAAQSFLRTTPAVTLGDVTAVAEVFDIPDLAAEIRRDLRGRGLQTTQDVTDLVALRDQHKLTVEGMIWALLYGFHARGEEGVPSGDNQGFEGIPEDLTRYWRRRLRAPATAWRRQVHGVSPSTAPDGEIGTVDLGRWLVALAREAQRMTAG